MYDYPMCSYTKKIKKGEIVSFTVGAKPISIIWKIMVQPETTTTKLFCQLAYLKYELCKEKYLGHTEQDVGIGY